MQNLGHTNFVVGQVSALEAGDRIAMPYLRGTMSGVISAVVNLLSELTDEQREYLRKNEMHIPEICRQLGADGTTLAFGRFVIVCEDGSDSKTVIEHVCLRGTDLVVTFPDH